jgi:serine/threonine protein kinase
MSPGEAVTAGPYRVLEHLGGGGQGEVFRAVHKDSQCDVALKRIWLGRDSDRASKIRAQIEREVAALRHIDDLAIVHVFGWGNCPEERTSRDPLGFAYVVYELVKGATTLRSRLRRGRIDGQHVAETFFIVAGAVQRLHDGGVYHRDIKPENVMLRGGEWNNPVLIDFGSVRADGVATLTRSGFGHGTVGYMAPEIVTDPGKADLRKADQWSLARVFAEAFGVAAGLSSSELRELRGTQIIDLLRDDLPNISKSLKRALSPQPERRFLSLWEFGLHIETMLARDYGKPSFGCTQLFREGSVGATARAVDQSHMRGRVSLPPWLNDSMTRMRHLLATLDTNSSRTAEEPAVLSRLREVFTGEWPTQSDTNPPSSHGSVQEVRSDLSWQNRL